MSWIQIWQWRNLKSGCGCFLVKSFQIVSALWSLFDYEGWHHADRWSHKALTPANSGCFVSDLRAKDQHTGSMRFILKVPDLVHQFGIWLSCWFYEVSRSAVQYLNDLVTGSHHIKGNLQVIQKCVSLHSRCFAEAAFIFNPWPTQSEHFRFEGGRVSIFLEKKDPCRRSPHPAQVWPMPTLFFAAAAFVSFTAFTRFNFKAPIPPSVKCHALDCLDCGECFS